MAINFPTSPSLNQTYTVGNKSWIWNGYAWDLYVTDLSPIYNQANSAFNQANTATTIGQAAFNQANSAYSTANTKFNSSGGTISGDVTVTGNVIVNGTTTTLNVTNLSITDNTIELRRGTSIVSGDGGIQVNLTTDGSGTVTSSRTLNWDNSSSTWKLSNDGSNSYSIPTSNNNLSFFSTTTSSQLAGVISDETGTGNLVFSNNSTLVSPTLSGNLTLSSGTANSVVYLNGSKVVSSGNELSFNGSNLGINTSSASERLTVNNTTGATTGGIRVYATDQAYSRLSIENLNGQAWHLVSGNPGASNSGFAIYDYTNSSTRFYIDSYSNIGIGTNIPQNDPNYGGLTVNGTNGSVITLRAGGINSGRIYTTATNNLNIDSNGSDSGIILFRTGTGSTERMRLDSSGNLGLGVTPSAWSGYCFDMREGASISFGTAGGVIASNAYYNSGWKYKGSSYAVKYDQQQNLGYHAWYTAPSGTAGNAITFTQAMTLNSSGNLGIGTTSPAYKLVVEGQMQVNATNAIYYATGTTGWSGVSITSTGGNVLIGCDDSSAGTFGTVSYASIIRSVSKPFYIQVNGNNSVFDASGNLGLGVTPSAWSSTYKAIQLPSSTYGGGSLVSDAGSPAIVANAYSNSGWKYVNNDYATIYQSRSGQHQWYIAPSGTAGNAITWTQAMTLDASGNLGVGVSSPDAKLHVGGTGFIHNNSNADPASTTIPNISGTYFTNNRSGGLVDSEIIYGNTTNSFFRITNMNSSGTLTEQMRLNASGNLGIGTTNPSARLSLKTSSVGTLLNTDDGTVIGIVADTTGNVLTYGTYTSHQVSFKTGNTDRVRIDTSGNVGIGSTSPSCKLEINDSSTGTSPLNVLKLSRAGSTTGQASGGIVFDIGGGGGGADIYTTRLGGAGGRLHFRTDDTSGSKTSRVMIDELGNIGVSTTSVTAVGVNKIIDINASAGNAAMLFFSVNGTRYGMAYAGSTEAQFGSVGNVPVLFKVNDSEKFRILTDGRGSFGRSDPSANAKFTIANGALALDLISDTTSSSLMNANATNNMLVLRSAFSSNPASGGTNAGAKWGIHFYGGPSGDNTNYPVNPTSTSLSKSAAIYALSEETDAGYNRKVGLSFYTSSFDQTMSERVRIDNSGKVGIGTSTPECKLHVFNRADAGGLPNSPVIQIEHQDINAVGTGGSNGGRLNFVNIQRDNTAWSANAIWGRIDFYGSQPTSGYAQLGASILAASDGSNSGTTLKTFLAFYTSDSSNGGNNVERLRISQAGYVGIGTTNPISKLNVNLSTTNTISTADSSCTAGVVVSGSDSLVRLQLGVGNSTVGPYGGWIQASYDNGGGDNGVEPLLLNPIGGYVGVGTLSPSSSYKLHVQGSQYINDSLYFQTSTGVKLRLYDASTDKYGVEVQSSELRIYSGAQGTTTGGITFGKFDGTTFTENVRFTNNGNLLLGATSIGSYSSKMLISGGTGGYQGLAIDGNAGIVNFYSSGIFCGTIGQSNYAVSGAAATGAIGIGSQAILYFASGGTTERMRLDSSGNLGIGTTSPAARLDIVSGSPSTTNALQIKSNAKFVSPDGNSYVTSRMTDYGALTFSSTAGQLFSITNSLSGTLFAINDISGMPSIEVLDTGNIKLAQYSGYVGIGSSSPIAPLDITATLGTYSATGNTLLRLTNPSSTGQSPLDFFINGTLKGRFRSDYSGNMNYVVNGGSHLFYIGGDSGVGSQIGYFDANGVYFPKYYDSNNSAYFLDPSSTGISLNVAGTIALGSYFVAGTSVSGGYYQDASNGAYRSILTSGDSGFYFQNNAGASTTAYIGLTGTYAGKVGIGTTVPSQTLTVNGTSQCNNGIFLNRTSSASTGINWYSSTFTAWTEYMANSTQTSCGPTANITAPSGTYVTSWARRSFIENATNYGWTWESGTSSQTTPTVVAELRSSDGLFKASGGVYSTIFKDQDNTAYYLDPASTSWSSYNAGGALFRNIQISSSTLQDTIQHITAGGTLWLNYSHNGAIGLAYGGGNVVKGPNQYCSPFVAISDIAPTAIQAGDFWWESDTGRLKVWYNDGNTSQWVDAVPIPDMSTYFSKAGGGISGPTVINSSLTVTGVTRLDNSLGVGTSASGTTGEIRASNNITAYYSSDKRLKENITKIESPLDKIEKINGVMFDWTNDYIESHGGEDGYFVRKHDTGVIAQEVEEILPEIVATRDDGYKAVNYEKLIPLLIESIKELKAEIETLKGSK